MAGTELAKAYVQIIPSAMGIKDRLKGPLGNETSAAADEAGKKAGGILGLSMKKSVVAAGIGVALKKAISEGANLEQSLGGIETLFKKSSDKVIANAKKAYMTTGLSANDYMESVTSFSASLLQGLAGDTNKAADIADMAMVDMSDNANKMGTDMQSIQNAYQGFAKQNYTMLDNLKLGYGGTKSEMERLLADAEKFSGVKYDLNNLSDVYSAIHVIQGELDITGTTAKEASTTLSGSMASVKASISNVLGSLAIGEDIQPALSGLIETATTFLINNLIPMVGNIIKGAVSILPNIVSAIIELAPKILKAVIDICSTVIQQIGNVAPDVLAEIPPLINSLITALIEGIPILLKAAMQLFQSIVEALPMIISSLLDNLGEIINEIVYGLIGAIPELIQGALQFFQAILKAIPLIIEELVLQLPWILETIIEAIIDGNSALIDAAIELFMALIEAIPLFLEELVPQLPGIVETIVSTLIQNYPVLLKGSIELFMALIKGIGEIIPPLLNALMRIVKSVTEYLVAPIKGLFKGLWEGIKNIFAPVVSWFSEKFQSAKDAITKPIEKAKEKIKELIDKIKGFFSGLKLSLPKIKMPHFKIDGEFSLSPLKVPKFSIDWYAKAMNNPMIMTSPTAFGVNSLGQVMAGGEAGPEVVSGLATLMNLISSAVASENGNIEKKLEILVSLLYQYLPRLAKMQIVLDSGKFVGETAPAYDEELGNMRTQAARGW